MQYFDLIILQIFYSQRVISPHFGSLYTLHIKGILRPFEWSFYVLFLFIWNVLFIVLVTLSNLAEWILTFDFMSALTDP